MRNLYDPEVNRYRCRGADVIAFFGSTGDEETGFFMIPSKIDRQPLTVIASRGDGWDHVSVSRRTRVPNWDEMSQIHALFFPGEEAMQLHVPASDHINVHPYCLHLWRPIHEAVPRPPSWMVGPSQRAG